MTSKLAKVVLHNVNGIQADNATNDFVFDGTATDAAIVTALTAFYNAGALGVHAFIGATMSRTALASLIEVYDITSHLDGTPHGSPTTVSAWTLAAPFDSSPDMPPQVACTLSMHAAFAGALEVGPLVAIPTTARAQREGAPATHLGHSRPKSSLRGRIFIGPLNHLAQGTEGHLVVTDLTNGLKTAATALEVAGIGWGIWSRRQAAINPIIGGWVDTDFTVIRPRKIKASGKVVWGS